MDPTLLAAIITGAVAVGGALSWGASKIWGARGNQDALAKSVETLGLNVKSEIAQLGLAMKAEVASVMTETKLQTLKLDTLTANLARVETNQAKHEAADDARFKEALADAKDATRRVSHVEQAVAVLQSDVEDLSDASKARHAEEIRSHEETKRRRTFSPGPFEMSRDPRDPRK